MHQIPLYEDTIVARATPAGEGAIAIVRLSGKQAIPIAEKLFRARSGKPVGSLSSHTLHYGTIIDPLTLEIVDEVLLAKMSAPHSYTGEDMVEIYCHGGTTIVKRLIELAQREGARLAEPGEFTRRAFINGRIDLVQAEAVADLVSARTEQARRLAIRQLQGELSSELIRLRTNLLDVAAEIEANLDFPEEEIPQLDKERLLSILRESQQKIAALIQAGERGRVIREGARVTIVGRPNTGKSSLFNALVGKERAIVTPHPGTTRDTIESIIDLQGIPLTLIDTAGVRSARDEIEAIGIRRTEAEIYQADLIIMLLDASEPLQIEDQDLWEKVYDKEHLIVFNKIDLAEPSMEPHQFLNPPPQSPIIKVSALKRLNLDTLEEAIIKKLVFTETFTEEGLLISNLRHINSLRQAYTALNNAIDALQNNQSGELIMIDLNEALKQLNSILGLEIGEEILDRIFSRFCIGK